MKRARYWITAALVLSLLLSGCLRAAKQETDEALQSASLSTNAEQPFSATGRPVSLEQVKTDMESLFRIQFEGNAVKGTAEFIDGKGAGQNKKEFQCFGIRMCRGQNDQIHERGAFM